MLGVKMAAELFSNQGLVKTAAGAAALPVGIIATKIKHTCLQHKQHLWHAQAASHEGCGCSRTCTANQGWFSTV